MGATIGTDSGGPGEGEAEAARELGRRLAPFVGEGIRARYSDAGREVELPLTPRMVELLVRMLGEMGRGRAVAVVPIDVELTTQQAADLLGVSRPFLIGLLEKDVIPHRRVGTHRRIRSQDLAEYQGRQGQVRRAALDELSAIGQELGLED